MFLLAPTSAASSVWDSPLACLSLAISIPISGGHLSNGLRFSRVAEERSNVGYSRLLGLRLAF